MKRPSILFVDDHVLIRNGLGHLLGQFADVTLAESSEQAHALLSDKIPDVIVSDISRPGTNGFEFLAAIRRDDRTRTTPFIFLTTQDCEDIRRKALMQGCDDFVSKNESWIFLKDRIEKLLAQGEAEHTPRAGPQLGD